MLQALKNITEEWAQRTITIYKSTLFQSNQISADELEKLENKIIQEAKKIINQLKKI